MDDGGTAMWKQVTAMHYNALQKQVLGKHCSRTRYVSWVHTSSLCTYRAAMGHLTLATLKNLVTGIHTITRMLRKMRMYNKYMYCTCILSVSDLINT